MTKTKTKSKAKPKAAAKKITKVSAVEERNIARHSDIIEELQKYQWLSSSAELSLTDKIQRLESQIKSLRDTISIKAYNQDLLSQDHYSSMRNQIWAAAFFIGAINIILVTFK